MNIRFSGFGGQGIVLSGVILGWAAIFDNKKAIQTQSYGSEARGGACKCDVIIDDKVIYELEPDKLDVLIAFSQPAFNIYSPYLKKDGTLFVDNDLVDSAVSDTATSKIHAIPATDIAYKKLNHKIMANIVMLGYFVANTGLISTESMINSIKRNVPPNFIDTNLEAFRLGLELT